MTKPLPPHDDIALILEDINAALSASELHGLLTGFACAGSRTLPDAPLRKLLTTELDIQALDDAPFHALQALDKLLRSQLSDDELGFELLLPEDNQPLSERIRGMADWCTGFLGGFGAGCGADGRKENEFSADARMLLASIGEFTRAETTTDDDTVDEDSERDFAELVEYLRIAALSIFLEFSKPHRTARTTPPPLH